MQNNVLRHHVVLINGLSLKAPHPPFICIAHAQFYNMKQHNINDELEKKLEKSHQDWFKPTNAEPTLNLDPNLSNLDLYLR